MSNMISTNASDYPDTNKSDWNTLQSIKQHDWSKKGRKRSGDIKPPVFFLWGLLLSLEFYDNKAFTRSCQNLLVIVWLRIHVWFSLLFSIKSDGAWLRFQVLSLSRPLKGCKMGLFRDFPEIEALTADPKQDQSYDFLKTCLNNEVAHGAKWGRGKLMQERRKEGRNLHC